MSHYEEHFVLSYKTFRFTLIEQSVYFYALTT